MKVTMISCSVEILIAGGVVETEDALTIVTFWYVFFFFKSLYLLFLLEHRHKCACPMVLGTMECQPSVGHAIQNHELQSIP